jgi:hypothetical protein
VGDDLTQYLWHRASHSALLWPLHRAHHTAQYMSIRVTYRNNFFYYLMMPGLWIAGVLTYLGFGPVYAAYVVVKLLVIMGAHCAWRWDEPLYRIKALRPLMRVLERTISTPATHWAHHAITNNDGVGHYKGNFGNLLFFWDILFRSAHITRSYPALFLSSLHEAQQQRRHIAVASMASQMQSRQLAADSHRADGRTRTQQQLGRLQTVHEAGCMQRRPAVSTSSIHQQQPCRISSIVVVAAIAFQQSPEVVDLIPVAGLVAGRVVPERGHVRELC